MQVAVALNIAPRLVASRLSEKSKKVYNMVRHTAVWSIYNTSIKSN